MSRLGLLAAKLFGKKLPQFESASSAERELFEFRDSRLCLLKDMKLDSNVFKADFSIESLKPMEKLYFRLHSSKSFSSVGMERKVFEECMAVYFGEVAIRNVQSAKWVVEEFAFEPGKYELGVKSGLTTIMLHRFENLYLMPNNKRQESIFRRFKATFH